MNQIIIKKTKLPEVIIIENKKFEDNRGFFTESYNQKCFNEALNIKVKFVQDNHSRSIKNTLRGMHYQIKHPQGKLVRVVFGEIFDVAVDMRKSSINFGKWTGVNLSSSNMRQLWIPPGFAHGFVVLSDYADVLYKTTNYWNPKAEYCLAWNDKDININWPEIDSNLIISQKDNNGQELKNAKYFEDL